MNADSPEQGDLFAGGGLPIGRNAAPGAERPAVAWNALDDTDLIGALPDAAMADSLVIVAEMGRRRLAAAIPALEGLCRSFAGFGLERIVPEQAAAIAALAAIGGTEASRAVARLIVRRDVRGPGLRRAVGAAASLGSSLPPEAIPPLLRHDDPEVRADAGRCIGRRSTPEMLETLRELVGDLRAPVREAAIRALGRLGRKEARDLLVGLLREKPSAETIDAIAPVADEACIVLLARVARENGDLRAAVLDALDAIAHPRAEQAAAALRTAAPSVSPET